MGALDGRVAVITGAGRGLGREHALLFASEGAKVVVNDLGGDMHGEGGDPSAAMDVVEEIKGMGGVAVVNGDNVADWDGAARLVQQAVDTFGDLHILVNNAGILRDRVIITGSGRGIGREHALAYAAEGAKVVVNDLGGDMRGEGGSLSPAMEVVEEIKAMGGEAVADGENVADFAGAGRMVQRAIDTFGRLDTLVNNAGILRDRMLVNMSEAEWDAVIQVHLKGTFAPSRHAAAHWR